jgi:hypothetical protein
MKEKIKTLKLLRIAYMCALEYDACPNVDEADWIVEQYLSETKENVIKALKEYEGMNDRNITDLIMNVIEDL